MNIDWTKAPDWAKHHAFNKNGEGFYYGRQKPHAYLTAWCRLSKVWIMPSVYTLPAGQDWRQSLVERPKEKVK